MILSALTAALLGGAPWLPVQAAQDTQNTENTENTEQAAGPVVAEVTAGGNTTEYTSIDAAWTAAIQGGTATIRLKSSISTSVGEQSSYQLWQGNLTLDMGGYTWTYTNTQELEDEDPQDLIFVSGSDASLTVTGKGTIRYVDKKGTGRGSACLYAEDGARLIIESGTFKSDRYAPVYGNNAHVRVEGGTFINTYTSTAGMPGDALTVNGGILVMSGGKVSDGKLALNNGDGNLEVSLSGGTYARIVSSGENPLKLKNLLAKGYAFRKNGSGSTVFRSSISNDRWLMDSGTLSGTSVSDVTVAKAALTGAKLTADKTEMTYGSGDTVTLTAAPEPDNVEEGGNTVSYEWYESGKKIDGESGSTYTVTADEQKNKGTYSYYVKATYDGVTLPSETIEITVNPVEGTIASNSNFTAQYTYGDFTVPADMDSANSGNYFSCTWPVTAPAALTWKYAWSGNGLGDGSLPRDAGDYILTVEAFDADGNYHAEADFNIKISPRTVKATLSATPAITKVYDGERNATADIVLDGVLPNNDVKVRADISYDTPDAGENKTVTASNPVLEGTDAKNYTLDLSQSVLTASGTITPARVRLHISFSPASQRTDKPVTVTVKVTQADDDNTPLDGNWIAADDILLQVSGRNDLEEAHRLMLSPAEGEQNVFTVEYVTAIKGDKTFTASLTGNNNYTSSEASRPGLSIRDRGTAVMELSASRETVTYGRDVTYTAYVHKENEDEADSLSGTVDFYLDTIESAKKIASRSVVASGDKVSVTLGKSRLTAGTHTVYAVFSGNSAYEGLEESVTTTVNRRQLEWNTSRLSASKLAGTEGEAEVFGDLMVDGIQDDDDITFKAASSMKTSGFTATKAGSYTVDVVAEGDGWSFDPASPANYILPEGNPSITAKVNAWIELIDKPVVKVTKTTGTGSSQKTETIEMEGRLMLEEGFSVVPAGLINTKYNTPAKIKEELQSWISDRNGYSADNTVLYDVKLQIRDKEAGGDWTDASEKEFPENGVMTVTLPYPEGTDRNNNFIIAHMFATRANGQTPGQGETPSVRKTDNGIVFTVRGLSPILVAWTGSGGGGGGSSRSARGSGSSRINGVATGDVSPILLYAGAAILAVVFVVVVSGVLVVRRKRRR